MEEIYLTVKELADLKGCTERYIRRLIEKNKMTAIEVSGLATGQGGIQYRIPLSALENRLQMKFKRRLKQLQKLEKQELPVVTEPPPISLENLTAAEREEILFLAKAPRGLAKVPQQLQWQQGSGRRGLHQLGKCSIPCHYPE